MKVKPWNRRLLIKLPEEEQQEESSILLPEDYKPSTGDHLIGEVLSTSTDGSPELEGKKVVFPPSSLEEIEIDGDLYYLILENYIIAVVN